MPREVSVQWQKAALFVPAHNGGERNKSVIEGVEGLLFAAAASILPADPSLDDYPLLEQVLHQDYGVDTIIR